MSYARIFIPLACEAKGYEFKGRLPAGRCVVESRGSGGKLSLWAQDLKPETRYGIFLIFSDSGRYAGVSAGSLSVDSKGKGEAKQDIDAASLINFTLTDISAVAVLATDASGVASPLCGYRENPVSWKNGFYVAKEPSAGVVKAAAEPKRESAAVPAAEPVRFSAKPAAPVAEPVGFASEPARLVSESTRPVEEPAALITEPAKLVAEPATEPIAEPPAEFEQPFPIPEPIQEPEYIPEDPLPHPFTADPEYTSPEQTYHQEYQQEYQQECHQEHYSEEPTPQNDAPLATKPQGAKPIPRTEMARAFQNAQTL